MWGRLCLFDSGESTHGSSMRLLALVVLLAISALAAPAPPPPRPVPIVVRPLLLLSSPFQSLSTHAQLWHGLGDRFDGAGLQLLKQDLEARPELDSVFVHIVTLAQDGPADQSVVRLSLT